MSSKEWSTPLTLGGHSNKSKVKLEWNLKTLNWIGGQIMGAKLGAPPKVNYKIQLIAQDNERSSSSKNVENIEIEGKLTEPWTN